MLTCDQTCNQAVTASPVTVRGIADLRQIVVDRLEWAGKTILAMPRTGYGTGMRVGGTPDYVRVAVESYGWDQSSMRPPVPSARAITAMDEAYGWLALIPDAEVMIRGIVGARSLVNPLTDRHVFSWRALGDRLGIHKDVAVRRHKMGIDGIVAALVAQHFFDRG